MLVKKWIACIAEAFIMCCEPAAGNIMSRIVGVISGGFICA
jgi:hypothetical protein